MRQEQYLLLDEPKKISPSGDPEGPTIDAPVLKILNYSGIDEVHEHVFIQIAYGYGFVNSKGQFKKLDSTVITEYLIDVDPVTIDGQKQSYGYNSVTRQKDKAGAWFSDLLKIDELQPNRCQGDFRVEDLYNHLMNKFKIKGQIKRTS